MSDPVRPEGPEGAEEETYITVDELSTPLLRQLQHQHAIWLFGSCCLAVIAYFVPESNVLLSLIRLVLGLVGLAGAYTRLTQINGIQAELKRREA